MIPSLPSLRQAAFTLAEIAMSLAVVSMGVITMFLMVPQGIRTQTQVRYKVIAAAKAQEVVNILRQHQPGVSFDARDQDKEGVFPWDTRSTYKSMAPDLEPMLENLRGTIKPLPEEIARRLVSDNDEIRTILNEGGRIYYFYPGLPAQGLESVRSSPMDLNWIDGSRKIIFGVVGAPQQNSILYHPSVKVGPYQDFYPSPPAHGRQSIMNANASDGDFFHSSRRTWVTDVCYDALARDAAIQPVFEAMKAFMDAVGNPHTAQRTSTSAATSGAYVEAALDYALDTGLTFGDAGAQDLFLLGLDLRLYEQAPRPLTATPPLTWPPLVHSHPVDLTPLDIGLSAEALELEADASDEEIWDSYFAAWPPRFHNFVTTMSAPDHWRRVLALRYLAHAAMTLSAHHRDDLAGDGFELIIDNPNFDPEEPEGPENPAQIVRRITLEGIRAWHEASVQMGIRHADQAGPYHWAAPRPLNRQVMMDHPLVQLDLQSPVIRRSVPFRPNTGKSSTQYPRGFASSMGTHFPPLVNSNQVLRQQWRALYPQAIQAPGLSDRPWMYPGRILDVNNDGLIDHHDLNLPNASTLHAEAAVGDARHFNLGAPFAPQERARQLVFWAVDWQSYVDFESAPSAAIDASRYPIPAPAPNHSSPHTDSMAWTNPYLSSSDYRRQINGVLGISALSNSGRNPELIYLFTAPSRRWDPSINNFSQDFSQDWYTNSNTTNIGQLNDDIPIMSEINVWLDPRMVHLFSGHSSSSHEAMWNSPGVRMLDLRAESEQNMPNAVRDSFYGHNRDLFNMMVFLGRYGANRDGNFNGEWVNWRQIYGLSSGSSFKNVAEVNRGSIPTSVQLRATTVARFNFYDPRLSGGLFQ